MAQRLFLLFGSTAAFFLALLLLRAAVHKLGDRPRFEGILADYAILPERTLTAAAIAIPILEIAASILLIVPSTRTLGATLTGTLLGLYALAMGIVLARGHHLIDCGCGDTPEPVGWVLVARNVALVALAALAATGLAAGRTSLAEDAAALAIGLLLLFLWLAAEVMLSNARRMNDTLPSTTRWSTP